MGGHWLEGEFLTPDDTPGASTQAQCSCHPEQSEGPAACKTTVASLKRILRCAQRL